MVGIDPDHCCQGNHQQTKQQRQRTSLRPERASSIHSTFARDRDFSRFRPPLCIYLPSFITGRVQILPQVSLFDTFVLLHRRLANITHRTAIVTLLYSHPDATFWLPIVEALRPLRTIFIIRISLQGIPERNYTPSTWPTRSHQSLWRVSSRSRSNNDAGRILTVTQFVFDRSRYEKLRKCKRSPFPLTRAISDRLYSHRAEDNTLFLGDGSLAGAPAPKLHQRGIRNVIKVMDERCL